MKTIFLRFPDEAAFRSTLPPEFEQQGETGYPLPARVEALRIVGSIYTEGVFDEQGAVVTAPELIDGFHVNVLLSESVPPTFIGDVQVTSGGPIDPELPDAWKPYQITPKNPRGVFGCDVQIILPPEEVLPEPEPQE